VNILIKTEVTSRRGQLCTRSYSNFEHYASKIKERLDGLAAHMAKIKASTMSIR
jgi:hypothetical protein